MLNILEQNPDAKSNFLMTDECIFSLDNTLPSSHIRYWSQAKPKGLVQPKPLQPKRLLVWCGMTARNVIGPYFFDGPVNTESYLIMLREFLLPELRRLRILRTTIFQQDGAPAHTAARCIDWLQGRFGERIISRRCDMKWPPRSPDLTPPDFFLWGYLKLRIKKRRPQSIEELKQYITDEIRHVDRDKSLLDRTFDDFVRRLRECVENNGSHVL